MLNDRIQWGMIGAGDVTEVKSGPAFRKVPDSDIVAVMRRDEEKVRDYAERHAIQRWYTDADALLADPAVNAVYIATPPHVHLHYVEKSLAAGKMLYVEKPLALNASEARKMAALLEEYGGKLVVAHYRRANPYYLKIKELVQSGVVGKVSRVQLAIYKEALRAEELRLPKIQWRLDPAISGGGLFHDLAPHQIDFLIDLFGKPMRYSGLSNETIALQPATRVVGQILFHDDVLFHGIWDFDHSVSLDECSIFGTHGSIHFSFFGPSLIRVESNAGVQEFYFEPLQHVQQPMIEQTVQYFLGKRDNPCTIADGIACMEVMDAFCGY